MLEAVPEKPTPLEMHHYHFQIISGGLNNDNTLMAEIVILTQSDNLYLLPFLDLNI